MTLLNATFPLYGIRAHDRIYTEYPYKYVVTKYHTYVLDMPGSDGKDLASRRLEAMQSDPGYKIYPLKDRYSTLAQVINSTKRTFVDSTGKVIKKTGVGKRYKCEYARVLDYTVTYNGKYLVHTRLGSFVTHRITNYIQAIRVMRSYVLLDTMDAIGDRKWITI